VILTDSKERENVRIDMIEFILLVVAGFLVCTYIIEGVKMILGS